MFVAVHGSVVGTSRTLRYVRLESAYRARAENVGSKRVFRILTQLNFHASPSVSIARRTPKKAGRVNPSMRKNPIGRRNDSGSSAFAGLGGISSCVFGGEMTPDQYREKAAQMTVKAREETSPKVQAEYIRLAHSYLRLAMQAETNVAYKARPLHEIRPPAQQQQQAQPDKKQLSG
jgi:hypothetical protein